MYLYGGLQGFYIEKAELQAKEKVVDKTLRNAELAVVSKAKRNRELEREVAREALQKVYTNYKSFFVLSMEKHATYKKSRAKGEIMTLILSSPLNPDGTKVETG
ncbi:hypothetical protein Tco_0617199 [Tanacetum coccineum]